MAARNIKSTTACREDSNVCSSTLGKGNEVKANLNYRFKWFQMNGGKTNPQSKGSAETERFHRCRWRSKGAVNFSFSPLSINVSRRSSRLFLDSMKSERVRVRPSSSTSLRRRRRRFSLWKLPMKLTHFCSSTSTLLLTELLEESLRNLFDEGTENYKARGSRTAGHEVACLPGDNWIV